MPADGACRRCSECAGQEHHWIENPDFEDADDPEFACKHCDATCRAIDDDDGLSMPSGVVLGAADHPVSGSLTQGPVRARLLLTEEQRNELLRTWSQIVGVDDFEATQSDKEYLDHLGSLVSDRAYAIVSLRRDDSRGGSQDPKDRPIHIHQVCPACRESYMVSKSDHLTVMEAFTAIGATARRARMMHRCPDVTAQLSVLSFDDLQKLAEDLERSYITLGTRQQEVLAYAAARRARETE